MAVAVASALANPERWTREGWKTDFSKSADGFDEIISGGPPRDGIPSIDDPKFVSASEVRDIGDREPVIQFGLGGDLRAYPLRVLTWHEIVNDVSPALRSRSPTRPTRQRTRFGRGISRSFSRRATGQTASRKATATYLFCKSPSSVTTWPERWSGRSALKRRDDNRRAWMPAGPDAEIKARLPRRRSQSWRVP
jgi:hypothetical protein